jgi:hypothetical protein
MYGVQRSTGHDRRPVWRLRYLHDVIEQSEPHNPVTISGIVYFSGRNNLFPLFVFLKFSFTLPFLRAYFATCCFVMIRQGHRAEVVAIRRLNKYDVNLSGGRW